MKRKLLPDRVSITLTLKDVQDFIEAIHLARTKLPPTPVVPDVEYERYEKMGEVKRKEATPTIAIFKEHGSYLPPTLSMEKVDKDLSVYDLVPLALEAVAKVTADLLRLQGLSGAEALNILRLAEDKTYAFTEADDVEDAIKARNEIDKLSRSSDKKPTKTTKITPDKP